MTPFDGKPGETELAPGTLECGVLAPDLLDRVRDFTERRLTDDIGVADLAGVAGMSPSHFSRVFRRTVGTPPHQYVIARRIERAKRLLLETKLLVTDIGYRCGFGSPTHFSASFRKVTGQSPQSFRRS